MSTMPEDTVSLEATRQVLSERKLPGEEVGWFNCAGWRHVA